MSNPAAPAFRVGLGRNDGVSKSQPRPPPRAGLGGNNGVCLTQLRPPFRAGQGWMWPSFKVTCVDPLLAPHAVLSPGTFVTIAKVLYEYVSMIILMRCAPKRTFGA